MQLGVDSTGTCDCTNLGDGDVLDWLHNHHREFNSRVWKLLWGADRLQAVRSVIRRDLRVPNTVPSAEEEFGHIVRKDYGRALLDHFLKAQPDPTWVEVGDRGADRGLLLELHLPWRV